MNLHTLMIGAFVACVTAVSAAAHEIHLYVAAEGGAISGKAYFEDDAPAADLAVLVQNADGEMLAELRTGADGRFIYTPDTVEPLTFVATTADGHRESFEVSAAEVQGLLAEPTQPIETVDTNRLASQIAALREQVNALQQRLWFRDVIGGVGYIFGVIGLIALWKARHGRAS